MEKDGYHHDRPLGKHLMLRLEVESLHDPLEYGSKVGRGANATLRTAAVALGSADVGISKPENMKNNWLFSNKSEMGKDPNTEVPIPEVCGTLPSPADPPTSGKVN